MRTQLLSALCLAVLLCSCTGEPYEYAELYKDLPFEMERIDKPVIPDLSVSITDFGGVGDVFTDNTQAFADAINYLSDKGGGHLIVPAGVWTTGPIELKSNIDLHLEYQALVSFDPDLDKYPMVETIYEGLDVLRCESPIHAQNASNFSISGEGVFDGNGLSWKPVSRYGMSSWYWKQYVKKGGVLNEKEDLLYPDESFLNAKKLGIDYNMAGQLDEETLGKVKRIFRPVMLSLRYCDNFLVEGCRFQNSPAWCLHFIICKNFIVDGVSVYNPIYAGNGDGIDIDSCQGVILVNSQFDAGDDGICIKSGKNEQGRKRGIPCKNILVDNCSVIHGHGGFVIGSEMSGGVENIKVTDCRFLGTDKGLRFKSTRGRGGVVKDIWVDGVVMKDIIAEAVLFNLYYFSGNDFETMPVDETTPSFRDIHISNVLSEGSYDAIAMYGLPELPVENVDFNDCNISSHKGITVNCCKDVTFNNVTVCCKEGDSPVVTNSENITFN